MIPLKIAHIVEDMKIGGQEKVIQSLLISLDRKRFTLLLLCLSCGGVIANDLSKSGVKTEILGIKNFNNPVNVWKVARWLRTNKVNIVHTHAHPAGYLGRMAAILVGGIGIIHHVHTVPIDLKIRHHLKERFLGFFSDKILCCSQAVKDFLILKEKIPDSKIEVVYNRTKDPLPEYTSVSKVELAKKFNIDLDSNVIGCIASLTFHKGHRYLLEAFSVVKKHIPKTKLLLLGDGPLRATLQEQADSFGIAQNIVFAGYQKDVFPFISLMDVVVLSSIEREGMGLSLVEAMAMGKPVVASKLHGIIEVVKENHSGILVPPGDSNAIAQAIIKVLQDDKLRKEMGRAGREIFLSRFTLDLMVRKIEDIYGEIAMRRNQ